MISLHLHSRGKGKLCTLMPCLLLGIKPKFLSNWPKETANKKQKQKPNPNQAQITKRHRLTGQKNENGGFKEM